MADPRPANDGPKFESLPADRTGITFVNRFAIETQIQFTMMEGAFGGGGVCIGDYDGDGLADIYFASPQQGNRLYRNLGDMRFEDTTVAAGVGADGSWSTGVTFVDIDNDNDLDIYVCVYRASNRLFVNQGDGTFTNATYSSRLDARQANIMMAFADYDRDGDMDAYLVTDRYSHMQHRGARFQRYPDGRIEVKPEFRQLYRIIEYPDGSMTTSPDGQNDHLFRNNGDGTFSDVSAAAGLTGDAPGLAATWWDYNDDGWPDIFVSNDFKEPDRLYHNNGDGTFTDVIGDVLPHLTWNSMGADAADVNNDGRIDFMATDMSGTTHLRRKVSMGQLDHAASFLTHGNPQQYFRNAVFLNTGVEKFFEAAYLTGMAHSDWAWGVKFGDLDNDGWVDVVITNGVPRDWNHSDMRKRREALTGIDERAKALFWKESPVRVERNLAFRNEGDLTFQDAAKVWGLDYEGVTYGAALGDLDRDGDLDLVLNNFDAAPLVYRNQSSGHGVLLRLQGTRSNRFGIGGKVTIETDAGIAARSLHLASGYMSANEPLVHFGTGNNAKILKLSVRWPSGHRQTFTDLDADRFYTVTEPSGAPGPDGAPAPHAETMFQSLPQLGQIRHRETPYDDFARQPLLPSKLSQLGPGMAWGDVDGDGDEDFYLAGAAGFAGQLCLRDAPGRFHRASVPAFEGDKACEDMGALLFDADSDGDLDLYVVSGGVECDPDAQVLADRLYLNRGDGQFTRAGNDRLPDCRDSGSVVAAADFDRDGDLDLFVGGLSLPGKYPLAAMNRLLRNDRGKFADVTDSHAPALRQSGLVTSAIWSDADGDGWVDLLVTHAWGPVKLFRNERGRLVERTAEAQLTDRRGWWNGIAAGDVDRDGDIDYVVTNVGLNTKYHATPDKPTLIYYGDFDEMGKDILIEAQYEGETLHAVRGKRCLTKAIPFLAFKFPTYHAFGSASLQDMFSAESLADALRLEANTLESGLLLNDGAARFTFQALPRLAQISPGFGVAVTDVDGDGNLDIYVVQNFFSSQPQTGHMDGGLSLLLMGHGDAKFSPVWPDKSGLLVPGDAKSLTTCDLNDDGWVDFVVGVNDDRLVAFTNRGAATNRIVAVRLVGGVGNRAAVGARVTISTSDGRRQTAEVTAGGGYLSQASAQLVFGLGPEAQVRQAEVRWPSGESSLFTEGLDRSPITLRNKMRAESDVE